MDYLLFYKETNDILKHELENDEIILKIFDE
jgi:hypothetical protein